MEKIGKSVIWKKQKKCFKSKKEIQVFLRKKFYLKLIKTQGALKDDSSGCACAYSQM